MDLLTSIAASKTFVIHDPAPKSAIEEAISDRCHYQLARHDLTYLHLLLLVVFQGEAV